MIIRRGMDWTTGFINNLYTPLETTHYKLLTHTSVLSLVQSTLAVSWQRVLTLEL
jgi:hypothetical protein